MSKLLDYLMPWRLPRHNWWYIVSPVIYGFGAFVALCWLIGVSKHVGLLP